MLSHSPNPEPDPRRPEPDPTREPEPRREPHERDVDIVALPPNSPAPGIPVENPETER